MPPRLNLTTPRGVGGCGAWVVTTGLFCASTPGNYSLLSRRATGGEGIHCCEPAKLLCSASISATRVPNTAERWRWWCSGGKFDDGGRRPSAPRPLLRWLRAQLKLQRWRRRHLCRLSSSLFIRAPPPTPANRANPLPAEHSQYRGLVGGHLSLSDPMSGHPPATATSN